MAFEVYPYTNFHDLNLDWIIQKFKEWGAEWAEVKELFDNFSADLTDIYNRLDNYGLRIEGLEVVVDRHTDEISRLGRQIAILNSQLDYELGLIEDNYTELRAQIDTIAEASQLHMYSPFTGEYVTLETVINELADFHLANAITAGDYDAVQITAGAYDALDLTAIEYDSNATAYIHL